MADWTSRTITTTTVEYVLPNPTNWTQVRQVLVRIGNDLVSQREYDDTVTVRATDDEIIFSYQAEKP